MKVLVVGANGFLGRSIVTKCLEKGWETVCVINTKKDSIPKQCQPFTLDEVTQKKESFDAIFLVAAYIPYGFYNVPDKQFIETNIMLPIQITKAFPQSKIVYASSASVYGETTGVITEDSEMKNPTLYGLSKLAGECVLRNHAKSYIIRFTSLFGPGMTEKTFLRAIIQKARTDKKIQIFDSQRKQNYLFVDNAADLCLLAADSEAYGVYVGADDRSYTNKEVGDVVAHFIPGSTVETMSTTDPGSYEYSNAKAKKAFGFVPHVSFQEGIQRLCAI